MANPTPFKTLHSPYISLTKSTTFTHSANYYIDSKVSNSTAKFRVFVPPGATELSLKIKNLGDNVVIGRFNQITSAIPDEVKAKVDVNWNTDKTLSSYKSGDTFICNDGSGNIEQTILTDSFSNPTLEIREAGWLYLTIGGGSASSTITATWVCTVGDYIKYSGWWNSYGTVKEPVYSIHWGNDVENLRVYSCVLHSTTFTPNQFAEVTINVEDPPKTLPGPVNFGSEEKFNVLLVTNKYFSSKMTHWGTPTWDQPYCTGQPRIFIPPGATRIDIVISNFGDMNHTPELLMRFGSPIELNNKYSKKYGAGNHAKLKDIRDKTASYQFGTTDPNSNFSAVYDMSYLKTGLPISEAGWLYLAYNKVLTYPIFEIQPIIYIENTELYDYWFRNYGSNEDGSINFENDILNTVIYKADDSLLKSYYFNISKVATVDDYLWLSTSVNNTVYCGAYNQGDGATPEQQCYYRLNSDYSTTRIDIPNSTGHESTRVFNLNGHLYTITEGLNLGGASGGNGALVIVDGNVNSPVATFPNTYLLTGVYYSGKYLIGWYDRDAGNMKLYNCPPTGGKTLWSTVNIMSFCMDVDYDGTLCIVGNVAGGTGLMVVSLDSNGQVRASAGTNPVWPDSYSAGANWCVPYNGFMYIVGGAQPKVYKYYIKYEITGGTGTPTYNPHLDLVWTGPAGTESAGACVYQNRLMVAIAGNQSGAVYSPDPSSGAWGVLFSSEKISGLGLPAPNKTNLECSSGFFAVTSDAAYLTYVLNSGRTGPSNIYKITATYDPVLAATTTYGIVESQETILDWLNEDLNNQYLSTAASINYMENQKYRLEQEVALVTQLQSDYAGNEKVAALMKYHIEKQPGAEGNFGLQAKLDSVTANLDTQKKNMDYISALSLVYTAIANGDTLPETLPEVPLNDPDNTEGKPDFIYKDRTDFPPMEKDDQGNDIEWEVGSTCVVDGVLYVFVGTAVTISKYIDNDTGWEPASCQVADGECGYVNGGA